MKKVNVPVMLSESHRTTEEKPFVRGARKANRVHFRVVNRMLMLLEGHFIFLHGFSLVLNVICRDQFQCLMYMGVDSFFILLALLCLFVNIKIDAVLASDSTRIRSIRPYFGILWIMYSFFLVSFVVEVVVGIIVFYVSNSTGGTVDPLG